MTMHIFSLLLINMIILLLSLIVFKMLILKMRMEKISNCVPFTNFVGTSIWKKVLYYIQFVIHYFVALHRAGKHMENSIIASYVALLLGCLIQDNSVSSASVI